MAEAVTLDPKELVLRAPNLGSPPLVYRRLMAIIDDPRSGPDDVAGVISQDTALTIKLLKLVNSALFSFGRRIDTVSQAVEAVGTNRVRDLALATSVTSFFRDVPPELIHAADFWRHSLACGVGARAIATHLRARDVERFFVAGMLHDVGRLVLYTTAPPEACAIHEHARSREIPLYEAERELMGFDHGTVGGALMEHWNMPSSLTEAVALHHRPDAANLFRLEAVTVHAADIVANSLGLGRSGERLVPPRCEGAWSSLGIDGEAFDRLTEKIQIEYREALSAFGLTEAD
mgnify:FL=1